MNFASSLLIKMLEKELAAYGPDIEKFALQFLGQIAGDFIAHIEKKIEIPVQDPSQVPEKL